MRLGLAADPIGIAEAVPTDAMTLTMETATSERTFM